MEYYRACVSDYDRFIQWNCVWFVCSTNFTPTRPLSFHLAACPCFRVTDSCLLCFFPVPSRASSCSPWVMSCFKGKDGIVYGKAGQELAMSQSRRVQNARKRDESASWVWSSSGWPRCVLACGPKSRSLGWTAARWVGGGRIVAFSFWNVMWRSCGAYCIISRKSVWILFPYIYSRLHPSACVALRVLCHLVATKDSKRTDLPGTFCQKCCVILLYSFLRKLLFLDLKW